MGKIIFCSMFSILPLVFFSSNAGAVGTEFDFLKVCDDCTNPAAIAKSVAPIYSGRGGDELGNEEEPGEAEKYSVVVVDGVRNKYFTYELSVTYDRVVATEIEAFSHQKSAAKKALRYFNIKHKLLAALHRNYTPSAVASNSLSSSSSAPERDCLSPGDIYSSMMCQSLYIDDIKANILQGEVSTWLTIVRQLKTEVEVAIGTLKVTAKYEKETNTVFYHLPNGAIVAFTLNDSGTGVIAMDTANSVYSSGKTLDFWLRQDGVREGKAVDAEEWLETHDCSVTGGGLIANYIYTIYVDSNGGIYIDTHSEFEEVELEVECN